MARLAGLRPLNDGQARRSTAKAGVPSPESRLRQTIRAVIMNSMSGRIDVQTEQYFSRDS